MGGDRIRYGFVTTAFALAASAGCVSAAPAMAEAGSSGAGAPAADTATLSVSASASVTVEPDRARLRFAIETESETAAEASRRNAELTTAAIEAAREFVGAEGDLSTAAFSVQPVYSRDGARRVVGYRTTNALVVVLDDLTRVGPTIDATIGAGANRVDGLEFYAADSSGAYLQALAEAVSRARREAEVMASAAGGALGRIVSLRSTRSGEPVAMMMAESFARADTPIAPGDQTIGASVNLEIQLLGR